MRFLEVKEETGQAKILLGSSNGSPPKKLISTIYLCLQMERKFNTAYMKVKWEKEAKIITDDNWLNMQRCDSYIRFRLWTYLEEHGALFVILNFKSKQCNNPEKTTCFKELNVPVGPVHIIWAISRWSIKDLGMQTVFTNIC